MAVQILNFMPDAEVHRGEPLTPMRALAPHRTAESFYSRLSGRAWFALGTFAVHVLAIAGFMTAQRLHLQVRARKGSDYEFSYSSDGKTWRELRQNVSGRHLPPWDRAVRASLTVGGKDTAEVRFDSFIIEAQRSAK